MSNLHMHNLCHGVLTFKLEVMPWCNSSKYLPPKEVTWCLLSQKMGKMPLQQFVPSSGWRYRLVNLVPPRAYNYCYFAFNSSWIEVDKEKEKGIQLQIRIGFLGWITSAIRMLVWAILSCSILSFSVGGENWEELGFRLGTSWASVRMVKA